MQAKNPPDRAAAAAAKRAAAEAAALRANLARRKAQSRARAPEPNLPESKKAPA